MEFFDVVQKRRSTRKFKNEPVPQEAIDLALDAALIAPNSSNLQCWEFYQVQSEGKKKALVEYCFSQGAASTAQHLVVAVSRFDHWKHHRDSVVEAIARDNNGQLPTQVLDYYRKIVPMLYVQDPFGILAVLKTLIFNAVGLFKVVPRTPFTRAQLFEAVTKSAALACQNFMLAMTAQGFATCPMEGFDERRVKRLLGLGRAAHVVMVIGVGVADPTGIWGRQFRLEKSLVVKKV